MAPFSFVLRLCSSFVIFGENLEAVEAVVEDCPLSAALSIVGSSRLCVGCELSVWSSAERTAAKGEDEDI